LLVDYAIAALMPIFFEKRLFVANWIVTI